MANIVRHLGIAPRTVIDVTLVKHRAIREMFYQPWALRFQNIDSRICERIIEKCLNAEIPVLTVHDSFIARMNSGIG